MAWRQYVRGSAGGRPLVRPTARRGKPPHVGVLLENVPEYLFWLGAAALTGTRARRHQPHLPRRGARRRHHPHRLPAHRHRRRVRRCSTASTSASPTDRVLVVDDARVADALDARRRRPRADARRRRPVPADFTSGTTRRAEGGALHPGPAGRAPARVARSRRLGPDDVVYMPCRCSTRTRSSPRGRRRSSAACTSARAAVLGVGPLPDIRHYGATLLNYVGKPLTYILATPEQPDDADNPLRLAFGNEASDRDIARVRPPLRLQRHRRLRLDRGRHDHPARPAMPAGALGSGRRRVTSLDPETGEECPPARFDDDGRLLNPDEAIGEIVKTAAASGFEGYYKQRRGDAGADPRRLVLDGRPRLPRRRRLALLRRPLDRVAARRRRELRRRAVERSSPATTTCARSPCTRCPTSRWATR